MFNWMAFILWTVIFSVFILGFLYYKKKPEWKSAGMVQGFLIALFAEMFGLPLSIYILSSLFGMTNVSGSENLRLVILGKGPWQLPFVVGAFTLQAIGFILIGVGWHRIYKATEADKLVIDGIYSRVRHPQYLGLIIITAGLLLWWPTIIIFIMWPILCVMYYFLARREEKEMVKKFGDEYLEYKERVNMFLPLKRSKGTEKEKGPERMEKEEE